MQEMFNNSCNPWVPQTLLNSGHLIYVYAALYVIVGTFSLIGNSTIVFLVLARSELRTIMNIFVANLAVSDLLVTLSSFWINPVVAYYQIWLFGESACYFWSCLSTASVLICTFTLTAIALDRYMLIVHPFKHSMTSYTCGAIVALIWLNGCAATIPIFLNTEYLSVPISADCYHSFEFCGESGWHSSGLRVTYGTSMFALKTLVPFGLIAYSYGRISSNLHLQHRRFSHIRSTHNRILEILRLQRLQKILIAMVVVFGLCSAPNDVLDLLGDIEFYVKGFNAFDAYHKPLIVVTTHFIAMTATLWNPLLYAGLNENFRRELMFSYHNFSLPTVGGKDRLRRLSSLFSSTFPSIRKLSTWSMASVGYPSRGLFREDSRNTTATRAIVLANNKNQAMHYMNIENQKAMLSATSSATGVTSAGVHHVSSNPIMKANGEVAHFHSVPPDVRDTSRFSGNLPKDGSADYLSFEYLEGISDEKSDPVNWLENLKPGSSKPEHSDFVTKYNLANPGQINAKQIVLNRETLNNDQLNKDERHKFMTAVSRMNSAPLQILPKPSKEILRSSQSLIPVSFNHSTVLDDNNDNNFVSRDFYPIKNKGKKQVTNEKLSFRDHYFGWARLPNEPTPEPSDLDVEEGIVSLRRESTDVLL